MWLTWECGGCGALGRAVDRLVLTPLTPYRHSKRNLLSYLRSDTSTSAEFIVTYSP